MIKQFIFIFLSVFGLKKRNLLVLFQNNNELRSLGGFITKALFLEIGRFRVKKRFLDIYNDFSKSSIDSPDELKKYLEYSDNMKLQFRDANVYLDDTESIQSIFEIFEENFDKKVNKLVLVNFNFFQDLVGIYGPLNIDGEIINEGNVFHYISSKTTDIDRHSLDELKGRKDFLKNLMVRLFIKMLNPFKFVKLYSLCLKSAISKDLQFFGREFKKELVGPLFRENNYLGLKNNRYIKRTIEITTNISESVIKKTYVIKWQNPSISNWPLTGLYSAKFSFKLEDDFNFVGVDGFPDIYDLSTKNGVVSFFFQIEPKSFQEVILECEKKISSVPTEYRVIYNKQSGVSDQYSELVVVPRNYSIIDGRDNVFSFVGNDQSDMDLKLNIKKNYYHPRVVSHEIVSENIIYVDFNEDVFMTDEFSCEVFDKKDSYDVVTKVDNKRLIIQVNDWNPSVEQFFKVRLSGLVNNENVCLSPEVRLLTVVYRPYLFN